MMRQYLGRLSSNLGTRDRIRIFCYHGVVERITDPMVEGYFHRLADFRAHVRLLRRFHVLSLAELGEAMRTPRRRRTPAAVLTFDDGYVNTLLAQEVLAAARLPWSLFVTTEAVTRQTPVRPMEAALLVLHGHAERLDVLNTVWSLTSRTQRVAAWQALRRALKTLSATQAQHTLTAIQQQFPPEETQRLLHEIASLNMLSWDEVVTLANAGVEIGSHGVTHELHHPEQPAYIRQRELTDSKTAIEQRLGRPCRFFAFPHGVHHAASAAEVQAAGYELACTTRAGTVTPGADPYLLPRLSAGAALPAFLLRFFWGPL